MIESTVPVDDVLQRIAVLEAEWARADMDAERLVDMYDDPSAGDHLRQRQTAIREAITALAVRAGIGYRDAMPWVSG